MRFAVALIALIFAVALMPGSLWANTTKNCPLEPAQAGIVSGETYFGTNCVLNTAADQDIFTFTSTAGATWRMVAGGTTLAFPNDICMTLHDPVGNTVTSACSSSRFGPLFAAITTQLTVAGTYSIDVSETQSTAVDYGISLERISPAPADGIPLVLGSTISGGVTPPSAQIAYTLSGTTTGTYQITATMTSGAFPQNLCFNVYRPGGTAVVSAACTNTRFGTNTAQASFIPPVNGTYVPVVYTLENNDTLNYTLSVVCVSAPGTCGPPPPPPPCSLKDVLSYNATTATLTMNFTLGTPVAATWNAWLTTQNTIQQLWSLSEPITNPAVTITKTQALVKSGKVGVLSTLTTPTKGITCSSFVMVNTGTP